MILRQAHKEKKRKAQIATPQNSSKANTPPKAICIGLNLTGILFICVGLLIMTPLDWNYIILGIVMVFIGTIWPFKDEPGLPYSIEGLKSNPESEAADKSFEKDTLIKILNLKQVGFENKSSYLIMQISQHKRRLRELDTITQEPYTFS